MPKALKLLSEVENLAEQYWRALQIGQPNILTDEQIGEVPVVGPAMPKARYGVANGLG